MTKASEPQSLQPATRTVRVIGIGNPDRCDDGIGWLVAQRLAGRLPPDVSVLTRGGDVMDLGDDMLGIDALICIDASAPMGSPGRIRRIDPATGQLDRNTSFTSSHALGLGEVIALAEALGTASRDIVVYAVEGASFDAGAPITPEVMAVADEVARQVSLEVNRLRRKVNVQEGTSDA
ncbi:hydrogenase maturation protease (plasmid) [Burkholderia thailandensis]|uniref:hydrogenase maturation protease n=1 Tax=Burkholderia thailandensis TaxID=57975 RepID=UPI00192E25B7|nr:hydrogenase maturation protease [Burkholderia thailandensis]MBS2132198.1 hydrogenase maturation protease [Burkholderia thailandensis]QRA15294.1 hydrogenase maturation protease [Burkholderia thailandensis]